MAKLPPDYHEWLKTTATLWSYDWGMTMNDFLIHVLEFYRFQPESMLDHQGRRLCCGTDPKTGHRGTCNHSAERGGKEEYARLQAMWQRQEQAQREQGQ